MSLVCSLPGFVPHQEGPEGAISHLTYLEKLNLMCFKVPPS